MKPFLVAAMIGLPLAYGETFAAQVLAVGWVCLKLTGLVCLWVGITQAWRRDDRDALRAVWLRLEALPLWPAAVWGAVGVAFALSGETFAAVAWIVATVAMELAVVQLRETALGMWTDLLALAEEDEA